LSKKAQWHSIEWTPEKITRFWDFAADWEPWHEDYFSKLMGEGIINFLKYLVPLKGIIIDYGCGPGYLLEHLLKEGARCIGIDSSPESVEKLNNRFRGHALWEGAYINSSDNFPLKDKTADLVLCIETLEHLLPFQMDKLFSELHDLIKPGVSRLFITVPNSENLARNQVYCADCGCVLHRYQHISSFTQESLQALLSEHGFRTIMCITTDLTRFQKHKPLEPKYWSFRYLLDNLQILRDTISDKLHLPGAPLGGRHFQRRLGTSAQHLIWLGDKP
jgi:SAM-dependent methyltransferase